MDCDLGRSIGAALHLGRRPWNPGLLVLSALLAVCGCDRFGSRADLLEQRRARLAAMSASEKSGVAWALERLEALDPAERERLRRLNRRIDAHPESEALRRTAGRYYEWLKTQPLYRRAEIGELPPAERIAVVRRLLEEEEERALRRPKAADAEGLLAWMTEFARRHEAEVLATLPPERKEELESDPEHRTRLVMSILWMRWRGEQRDELPQPTEKDLVRIYEVLTPATREKLRARPPQAQWELISSWARYLVHYQGDLEGGAWTMPEVSEAELMHFFEYELTPEQRDELLALPGERMQRRLRQLYFRIKVPHGGFGPAGLP